MDQILQLGPLALPVSWLVLFVAWQAGSFVAERRVRRQGRTLSLHGWLLPFAGWASARAGFVAAHWEGYAGSPASLLGILDIRDGGWFPWTGLLVALIYGLVLAWRSHPAGRPLLWGLGLFCALWLGAQAVSRALAGPPAQLPVFSAVALDARTVDLPALTGTPVVINLWASWCPPCRREMPVLLQAQRAHPEIRFLWVNQGESPEVVQRFSAQHGLPPDAVLLDLPSRLGQMLGRSTLPTTLFYNAQGQLADLRTGEVSAGSLGQHLQRIEPPAPTKTPP
ncbi:TlpA disulfide reductase family protein [Pantoea sp. 18069]|uniref:TlpA family protein disulfide reductase n=1 Tax=Pantoea sp. 18069 TaxID=2681415 RepID=UPI00135C9742|nr:TlpA disulfide reductase family protein [Pantoea sp. 18069]